MIVKLSLLQMSTWVRKSCTPWESLYKWDPGCDREQKPFGPFIQQLLPSTSECPAAQCYTLWTWRTIVRGTLPFASTQSTSRILSPGCNSAKAKLYLQEDDHCGDICNDNNKTGNNPGIYKSRMVSSIMRPNIQPTYTYPLAGPVCPLEGGGSFEGRG